MIRALVPPLDFKVTASTAMPSGVAPNAARVASAACAPLATKPTAIAAMHAETFTIRTRSCFACLSGLSCAQLSVREVPAAIPLDEATMQHAPLGPPDDA